MAAARSLGYELQVLRAVVARDGPRWDVSVTLTNHGVAPFYAAWPLQLTATDTAGQDRVVSFSSRLSDVQPGTERTATATLDLSGLAPGEVRLSLGVPNPLRGGKPLRFANVDAGKDASGRLTLGTLVLNRN